MDAFDSDVLIYAATPSHELGRRVRALFPVEPTSQSRSVAGVGSVLLLPELLTKPIQTGATAEVQALIPLLARLELIPVDQSIALEATALGVEYNLRAADAIHLASAVSSGAERFITNNSSDFPKSITEINVTYPDELHTP